MSFGCSQKQCKATEFPGFQGGKTYIYDYDAIEWEKGMWLTQSSEGERMRTARVNCMERSREKVIRWAEEEGVSCINERQCFKDPVWLIDLADRAATASPPRNITEQLLSDVIGSSSAWSCSRLRKSLCRIYAAAAAKKYPVDLTPALNDTADEGGATSPPSKTERGGLVLAYDPSTGVPPMYKYEATH
ncbi:hypothetical protein FOZ63_033616 [Perkinsus olseni]|uniref:Uncharacterized protein n=1 Tax=Perkinsus olseni TaxID=32597 RepID=A0A7J6SRB7_PEROL|nr:hypothetical protein FOZ63_033616 [Perkinsus olseni]